MYVKLYIVTTVCTLPTTLPYFHYEVDFAEGPSINDVKEFWTSFEYPLLPSLCFSTVVTKSLTSSLSLRPSPTTLILLKTNVSHTSVRYRVWERQIYFNIDRREEISRFATKPWNLILEVNSWVELFRGIPIRTKCLLDLNQVGKTSLFFANKTNEYENFDYVK